MSPCFNQRQYRLIDCVDSKDKKDSIIDKP